MNKFIPNIGNKQFKKFKKEKDKHVNKKAYKMTTLNFGDFGLKAYSSGFLNYKQIEACRRAIVRKLKRKGKLWINCYPYKPLTSKGSGVRMGKGKGNISDWIYPVYVGDVLFELSNVNIYDATRALKSGSTKLQIKLKIIYKKFY